LGGQIRRGVDQKPPAAAGEDCDGRLSQRPNSPPPGVATISAAAIPLRQPSAGGRS
jgi:hypothetical protein